MRWHRGRRCWWYMYPFYVPYAQGPQHSQQPPGQPLPQPPAGFYYPPPPIVTAPPTPEQELEDLRAYKAEIEEELRGVEARIKELNETRKKKE